MSEEVQLLSRPTNFAVVQLPGRTYPGVVMQGDSLHALVCRLKKVADLSRAKEDDELAAEIEDIREPLLEALECYESVCAQRGIALPYPKQV